MDNIYEELLKPVSLDEVCGVDLDETGEITNLELLFKGKEETQFSDAIKPDWKNIVNECQNIFSKSKDLWATSFLMISLYATQGFKGLNESYEFLLALLTKYWESIYPLIDNEDEEPFSYRESVFISLFSFNGILCNLILDSVLTKSKLFNNISVREALELIKSKNENKITELYNSIKDSPEDSITEVIKNIESILICNNSLINFINKRVKNNKIHDCSKDFIVLLKSISELFGNSKRQNSEDKKQLDCNTDENPLIQDKGSISVNMLQINSTQDIKNIFKEVYKWYKINEPSSPVPLLIKRAEMLLDKDFLEIIKNVSADSIPQLQNLFGITTQENENDTEDNLSSDYYDEDDD